MSRGRTAARQPVVEGTGPAERGDVLVVVPTYNEAQSIDSLIRGLDKHVPDADVLVVDDGSPDGTGELVGQLSRELPHVSLMRRPRKSGLGTAYRDGLTWGLAHRFRRFVQMDADGSHAVADVPRLLAALDTADVAIGSRYTAGGSIHGWPQPRQALSRVANAYARRMVRLAPRDVTAGFRAYRRDALHAIGIDELGSQGYCCQIELTRRAVAAGLDVGEVPIHFVERTNGMSKMSYGIVVEAVVRTTWWGVLDRLRATT